MCWRTITGIVLLFLPTLAWSQSIKSFSPSSGQPGNVVTINISGFSSITSVAFNNNQPTLADFTNVSASQLLVVVPIGATSGPLEIFQGDTGISTTTNFLVAPVITNFFPQSGAPPTIVSIEGQNFISGGTTVFFPGVATGVSATYIAPNEVSVTVPTGAGDGPLTVVTKAGTNVSTNSFLASDLPSVSSFSPTAGAIGTAVNIYGGNFFSGSHVKFGSVTATSVEILSTSEITATVPAGATAGPITVTTTDGSVTTASNFLTGTGPLVTGFSPTAAAVNSYVSVSGLNLSSVTSVTFNDVSETITGYVGDTNLQVDLVHSAGTGPIRVSSSAGSFTTSTNFTNTSAPLVTDFYPVFGQSGTTVTIDGSSFSGTPTVKFGSTTASSTLIGPTQISATVPFVAAGNYPIEVITSAGSFTTSSNFLIAGAGPLITGFSPSNGVRGATVTISGANFSGVSSVKFNGVAASFEAPSTTQMTAVVPADTASGVVTASSSTGTGTSPILFYLQPWITSLSTNGGIANQTFTIIGRSLTNVSSVAINDVNYNFIDGASQIVATIPSNATSGQIVITAPGGIFISTNTFAILPKIFGFSPTFGPVGTVVTITGTSLFDVTQVKFNGVSATVSSAASNQVQVAVPSGATTGLLTAVTPYGNDISTNIFTVTQPSAVLLTKTVDAPLAGLGTNITYTLLVTNEGPSIITSAKVVDTLPAGFTFLSATPSLGTWTNTIGALTWNIGTLSNGDSVNLDIVGTSYIDIGMTNTATLSFAEGNLNAFDDYASVANFFINSSQRTLSITPQSSPPGISVTWPESSVPFQLQVNTNLSTGWTQVTNVIANGLVNTFTTSFTSPQMFFRLTLP